MEKLFVKFDSADQSAQFSGPGTFAAKDLIKGLGTARWDGAAKVWKVKGLRTTEAELRAIFADFELETNGEIVLPEKVTNAPVTAAPSTDSPVPQGLSVAELVRDARSALQNAFPGTVLVYGVVDKVTRKNGRVFVSLADPEKREQSVSCAIWQNEAAVCKGLNDSGFQLEKDLQVMFQVKVSLSPGDARLSLTIVSIVAEYTAYKLAALRELTNKKLTAEGVFARNKSLALPLLPRRIGVLTSAVGTVINDFRSALDDSRFGFEIFWLHASVQGAQAKQEIISGLQRFSKDPMVDLIVLIRGGGSAGDLSVFNDYEVAKAICLCPLPVLSAIGHQADHSSAQDVSYRSFGVPKDVGRFLADIVLDLRARYQEALATISRYAAQRLELLQSALSAVSQALVGIASKIVAGEGRHFDSVCSGLAPLARGYCARAGEKLQDRTAQLLALASMRQNQLLERFVVLGGRLSREGSRVFERAGLKVVAFENQFRDLSPEVQLKRGFAIVKRSADGKLVAKGSALQSKDAVEIQFQDGPKEAVIK